MRETKAHKLRWGDCMETHADSGIRWELVLTPRWCSCVDPQGYEAHGMQFEGTYVIKEQLLSYLTLVSNWLLDGVKSG